MRVTLRRKALSGLLAFATLPLISSFVPIVVTTSLLLFVVAPLFFFASMVLVPIWPFILIFLLYQTKFAVEFANVPVAGEIKYWAHIIGFIAGEFFIIVLKGRKKKTEKGETQEPAGRFLVYKSPPPKPLMGSHVHHRL
ncbi:MAG: hypothetical protein QXG38_02195 [Candidatus Hadarchaeales archaeon]